MSPLEHQTVRKTMKRLIPFLILCYFVAFLDRVNVGFAALTMNKDLNFTAQIFGLGSGIFFLTYFLLEIPSNLALEKFGARKWIARIMFSWGILSGLMAFIENSTQFYWVRAFLGAAEAGFFPGIIFYLTLWFPSAYRGRIIGWFMIAVPVSSLIGSPLSGYILLMDGLYGLKGWQWLFIIEAIPSVVLAFVTWYYLPDRPSDASFLTLEEREWLQTELEKEAAQRARHSDLDLWGALRNTRVIALGFVYFGIVATLYGLGFFMPTIVKAFGLSNVETGFVSAIPYLIGSIAMVTWGAHSDKTGERQWHAILGCIAAALGLGLAGATQDPVLRMSALSLSAIGTFGSFPVFWTLPTAFLSGTAAAAGIALINSIGNLSGFLAPYMMGYMKDWTGNFDAGLYVLGGCAAIAGLIVYWIGHNPEHKTE
jgi:D-galactonate transporter